MARVPLETGGVSVHMTGHIVPTIDPWTQAPPQDPEATRASVIGKVYVSERQPATLMELIRLNHHSDFKAIFYGYLVGGRARCERSGGK
jgi:hypothetical protein